MLWASLPLLALTSLGLGYWGLGTHLPSLGRLDLVYNDLQLFTLGADALQNDPGPYPWPLEVARFMAPAVAIYTVIEAVRLLLSVELSRFRARHATNHAIVCGDSPLADALTRRLRARGTEVVEIRTEPDEYVTRGEPLRIIGDARDPEVLRAAGIDHASTLYACTSGSTTNFEVSMAAIRAAGHRGHELSVHSQVTDADFCATLQAFFLGRMPERAHLDFFNLDHIAARRLFSDLRPRRRAGGPERLMVAGTDDFARAAVVEAGRWWRTTGASGPLPLTLVGPGAGRALVDLTQRYPFLAQACDLGSRDEDLLVAMRRGAAIDPPDRLLVTHADEEYALKTAMTAERYWRGASGPITVRLDGALIGEETAVDRLEVAAGRLRVFGAVAAAGDPELIQDDLTERLARVLHDRYRRGRIARGDAGPDRAMVAWDDLPSALREANRSQAEDIGRKLARIGYVITPRYVEQEGEAVLAPADIDTLARMEHRRWCREKAGAGWKYAAQHDEGRRLHPGLLSWDRLPENLRMRNYDPVRELPTILSEVGFQIVRTSS